MFPHFLFILNDASSIYCSSISFASCIIFQKALELIQHFPNFFPQYSAFKGFRQYCNLINLGSLYDSSLADR